MMLTPEEDQKLRELEQYQADNKDPESKKRAEEREKFFKGTLTDGESSSDPANIDALIEEKQGELDRTLTFTDPSSPLQMDKDGNPKHEPVHVQQQMHPKFTNAERFQVKALMQHNTPGAVRYLQEQHPDMEIGLVDGQIVGRTSEEFAFRVLDEDSWIPDSWTEFGRDAMDIVPDILSAGVTGAMTAKGALMGAGAGGAAGAKLGALSGGAVAGGPGALAGAGVGGVAGGFMGGIGGGVAGGAASSAAVETLQQGLAKAMHDVEMSGEHVGLSALLGGAAPLLFGSGAGAKQIVKELGRSSIKGAGKPFVEKGLKAGQQGAIGATYRGIRDKSLKERGLSTGMDSEVVDILPKKLDKFWRWRKKGAQPAKEVVEDVRDELGKTQAFLDDLNVQNSLDIDNQVKAARDKSVSDQLSLNPGQAPVPVEPRVSFTSIADELDALRDAELDKLPDIAQWDKKNIVDAYDGVKHLISTIKPGKPPTMEEIFAGADKVWNKRTGKLELHVPRDMFKPGKPFKAIQDDMDIHSAIHVKRILAEEAGLQRKYGGDFAKERGLRDTSVDKYIQVAMTAGGLVTKKVDDVITATHRKRKEKVIKLYESLGEISRELSGSNRKTFNKLVSLKKIDPFRETLDTLDKETASEFVDKVMDAKVANLVHDTPTSPIGAGAENSGAYAASAMGQKATQLLTNVLAGSTGATVAQAGGAGGLTTALAGIGTAGIPAALFSIRKSLNSPWGLIKSLERARRVNKLTPGMSKAAVTAVPQALKTAETSPDVGEIWDKLSRPDYSRGRYGE